MVSHNVSVSTGDACESQTEQVRGEEGCLPHNNFYWLLLGHNSLGYDIQ